MTKSELKYFFTNFISAWRDRDEKALSTMYSKDVVAYMDNTSVGYNEIMERLEFSRNYFKEVIYDIQEFLVDGDKIVARIDETLVSRENKENETYKLFAIYEVKNSQVTQMWASFYPNVQYLDNER
jgi:hypothetical protein